MIGLNVFVTAGKRLVVGLVVVTGTEIAGVLGGNTLDVELLRFSVQEPAPKNQ